MGSYSSVQKQLPNKNLAAAPTQQLYHAVRTTDDNSQAILALLDAGADPYVTDSTGFNALHGAAFSGNVANVRALIPHFQDKLGTTTKAGQTALDIANQRGGEVGQHIAQLLTPPGVQRKKSQAFQPSQSASGGVLTTSCGSSQTPEPTPPTGMAY